MAIDFFDAKEIALKSITHTPQTQIIDIFDALGKVLATDIKAVKNLPSFNNSAMDGYAFRYEDINNTLEIVATIYAGNNQNPILKTNQCYKIMTGAKVPSDCDTVAQVELCTQEGNQVTINNQIKKANAIRLKGEEVKKGELILAKNQRLNYANIALLASQGIDKIEVYKELKIAILASGDELKEPWESASEDEIYNINSINIASFLREYGFKSDYLGRLGDNLEEITAQIAKLKEYDLIITSGGISAGEADFTKEAFLNNGFKELFHGVKVKPGHPTMFGLMDKTFVMAMPGNPLAAILNVMFLSLPVIFKLQGVDNFKFNKCKVKMAKDLKLKSGRLNIVLGSIKENKFYPYKDNKYGSGMIMPLVQSSAVALFEPNVSKLNENDEIEVYLLCKKILWYNLTRKYKGFFANNINVLWINY